MAAVGIMTTGCQKEMVQQCAELAPQLTTRDFKYSHEVIIRDKTQDNYVKYRVGSNDEAVAAAMASDLQNASLDMLEDQSPTVHAEGTDNVGKKSAAKPAPYDYKKGVHLFEMEKNIGNYRGYRESFPEATQKSATISSYSTISVEVTAVGVYVRNLWIRANYNYHYYGNAPGWAFDRMSVLAPGQDDIFTGGGFGDHLVISQPSYINSGLTYNNRIYWEVWP